LHSGEGSCDPRQRRDSPWIRYPQPSAPLPRASPRTWRRASTRSSASTASQSSDTPWAPTTTANDGGAAVQPSLGSTGQRHPHYSLEPVHGPGVGLGLWPQFLPPTCPRRACSVGLGFFRYVAFLAAFSRPLLVPCFSLCDLRLFVIRGIVFL